MEEFNEEGQHGENIARIIFEKNIIPNRGYKPILVSGDNRSEISESAIQNKIDGDGIFVREMKIEVKNSNLISVNSFDGFKGDIYLFNMYGMGTVFALKNTLQLHYIVNKLINQPGGSSAVYRTEMPSSKTQGYVFAPGVLRSIQNLVCGVDFCDEMFTEERIEEIEREKRIYRADVQSRKQTRNDSI